MDVCVSVSVGLCVSVSGFVYEYVCEYGFVSMCVNMCVYIGVCMHACVCLRGQIVRSLKKDVYVQMGVYSKKQSRIE